MWLAKSISVVTVGQVSYTNLSFIQNRKFFQFKYSVVVSFILGLVIISMKIIVQIKIRISLLFSSEECKKQCNAWIVGNYIRDIK